MREVPEWGRTGGLKPRQAVAGLAFAEQRPVMTADYLADDRFETTPEIEAFVRRAGIRAVIAAPLTGEGGGRSACCRSCRASPARTPRPRSRRCRPWPTHASIAITNAHLMEELARSRADIERRAEAERTLRQIAARITALREPDEVLQHVVDEAQPAAARRRRRDRPVRPRERHAPVGLRRGLSRRAARVAQADNLRLGEGVSGKAVAEGRSSMSATT